MKCGKCKGMRFMEAKIQKYKWDDLNLKKLSLNVNHFTDSSTVPAGTGTGTVTVVS